MCMYSSYLGCSSSDHGVLSLSGYSESGHLSQALHWLVASVGGPSGQTLTNAVSLVFSN